MKKSRGSQSQDRKKFFFLFRPTSQWMMSPCGHQKVKTSGAHLRRVRRWFFSWGFSKISSWKSVALLVGIFWVGKNFLCNNRVDWNEIFRVRRRNNNAFCCYLTRGYNITLGSNDAAWMHNTFNLQTQSIIVFELKLNYCIFNHFDTSINQ